MLTAREIIPNPVKLEFVPQRASASTRRVFKSPLARLLWLTWRPIHIVNQYFNDECLTAARWMAEEYPRNEYEFRRVVQDAFQWQVSGIRSFSDNDLRWVRVAWPFFSRYAGEHIDLYYVTQTGKVCRALP